MRKNQAIQLELTRSENNGVKFYVKQFDDLKLKAKIFDGLEQVNLEGQKLTVCIMKEDKTVIEQTKDIIVEDNTAIINLSKQSTTAKGKCDMEILLTDEDGTVSTSIVSYMVSEKLSASIVEMIKSEDDINALNLIEEFIENSNLDMIDIKEAIKELRDTVDGVQGGIDAEYETILEALRALEGTIIENIEGKANEAITIADEAVTKATEATETINAVLEDIEDIEAVISTGLSDIEKLKDESLEVINLGKNGIISNVEEGISSIETSKTTSVNAIEELKADTLETIRDNGNGVANALNSLSDTLKSDLANAGLLETNKVVGAREEALTEIDDLKDNAIGSLSEEALKVEELLNATVTEIKEQTETDLRVSSRAIVEETVENIETTKDEAIEGVKASKDTVLNEVRAELSTEKDKIVLEASETIKTVKEDAINEINTVKENVLSEANAELNNAKSTILSEVTATLEGIKTNAINDTEEELNVTVARIKEQAEIELNACKSDLDTYVILAKEQCKTDLNGIKDGVIVEVNNLKGEVDNVLASITEKITESNSNIEELAGLIEEAREVAGLVRAFIDSKSVDLSNYYTKEEVDKKINSYRGEIGYSEYKPKPEGFDEAFERLLENPTSIHAEIKGEVVEYIQGTISRTTGTNTSGARRAGVLLITNGGYYNNDARPIIENSNNQNREFDIIKFRRANNSNISATSVKNFTYPCIFNSETGTFERGLDPSSGETYSMTDYYYSTVDIYENDNATIAYPACNGEIETKISDFDEAIESGNYKVNIKEGEVIANTPLEGAIQGILNVNKAKDVIHQELSTNKDEVFSRIYLNGNWTEWKTTGASDIDLTNYITSEQLDEAINNIDIPEIDLSAYSTTEEIKTLLNESIGTIRASLIGDINDIVGGI